MEYDSGERTFVGLSASSGGVDVCLSTPSLQLEPAYIGLCSQKTLKIVNRSEIPVKFSWEAFATSEEEEVSIRLSYDKVPFGTAVSFSLEFYFQMGYGRRAGGPARGRSRGVVSRVRGFLFSRGMSLFYLFSCTCSARHPSCYTRDCDRAFSPHTPTQPRYTGVLVGWRCGLEAFNMEVNTNDSPLLPPSSPPLSLLKQF